MTLVDVAPDTAVATFLGLIYRLALLVALSVVAGFAGQRLRRRSLAEITQGAIFGVVAVIGLLQTSEMQPGVIIDARSVVVSLSGLFFGPLALAVTVGMATACRVYLGGNGALTGVLIIVSAAALALIFHDRNPQRRSEYSMPFLYGFGILVHIAYLVAMFALPEGMAMGVIRQIGLPVMLTYPLATVLIGKILSDQAAALRVLTELQESKEKLRTTLYSIGDAVVTSDGEGRLLQVNQVAEELIGWPEAEARGEPLEAVLRIIDEHTRAAVENPARRALREGRVVNLETDALLIARDGTERPVVDSAAPIRDATGRVTGAVLVFSDQTAEREARRALAESERRFRTLFEQAPVGIFRADLRGGLLNLNPAMARIVGCESPEDALARYAAGEGFHADKARLAEAMAKLRADGVVVDFELEGRSIDDRKVWLRMNARTTRDTVDGEFTVEGFTTDITKRKQAEEALTAGAALLNVSQRLSKVGGWEWDVEQGSMSWTDETYRIHGLEAGGFVPVSPAETAQWDPYYRTEDAAALAVCFQRCLEQGEPYDLEVPFTNATKGSLWIRTTGAAVRCGERIVKVFGNIMDITDRRANEAERDKLQTQLIQAQRMESIGRLAGGVAHDFNNLLMGIMGYAELCRAAIADDHPVSEWLDEITTGAERSADLTRQLLAFARRETIAPKALDLNAVVSSMLNMLRRLIGEHVRLSWQPGPGLWPVLMDPSQVDQILANLTVNARDAISGVGEVFIETENATVDECYCVGNADAVPGSYVVLVVRDNGCGMDRSAMEHLFEPFFTTKGIGKGTGLGLATVYGVVRQNAGFIGVESEVGRGTTFRIYLPRHGSRPAEGRQARESEPPTGSETILLVEDEESLLRSGRLLLESLGYHVLAAPGPVEAIELSGDYAEEIQLLLTDVIMPEMNGRELSERLALTRPDMACLFMSGYTANVIAGSGVIQDGLNFLQKPFSKAELAAKVRLALRAR